MFLHVSRSLPLEADTSLIHMSWALNLRTVLHLSYEITHPVNNLFLIPPAEICYRLPYTQQILIYFTDLSDAVYLPDLSHYIKHEPASWRPYIIIGALPARKCADPGKTKRTSRILRFAKAYIRSQMKKSTVNAAYNIAYRQLRSISILSKTGGEIVISQLNDRLRTGRQNFDAKRSMIFLLATKFWRPGALHGPSPLVNG
jgi:hypothetical protein